MKYVEVAYMNHKTSDYVFTRPYTYATSLPLAVMDKVLVPVKGKYGKEVTKRAIVINDNKPMSEIPEEIVPRLKEIVEYDKE